MKVLLGFYFLCLFALGQTKFIDMFADGKRLTYRLMDKLCNPVTQRCYSGVTSYANYASKCIYDGCRPASINSQYDVYSLKYIIDRNYEDGYMYIGLSDNNTDGVLRWANGRAATSPLDNQIISAKYKCPKCNTCFAFNYNGFTKRKRCTSSYHLIRGICECRSRTLELEMEIVNTISFNKNNDVMGGFRVYGSDLLSIKGTIATENKVGRFRMIIYLNLKAITTSAQCRRAETEKQDKFTFEEEVEVGDYFSGGTTKKTTIAQVHADLGEFEFPSSSSDTGSIISIEKSNIPKLKQEVSHKYFVVIWQNNRAIGCSAIFGGRLYGIWEQYNKAMFRYATGINIGTRNP